MGAADVLRNSFKDKLKRGEVVSSMTVRLIRTTEIARIAKTAGFDMLYIDLEHSSLSLDATGQICMAALDLGLFPAVRVPALQAAMGLPSSFAPHVRSAAEAREVVKAAKFPPKGERGNVAPMPHFHYRSFPAAEANAVVNDATMVIVQFESAQAVENAEEIASVDGVDIVLVGLNDYLADIGLTGQYDHPKVRECYSRVIEACRKHGKHCGVGGLASRPDLIAEYVKLGARYVSSGTDVAFLMRAAADTAKQVKEIKL